MGEATHVQGEWCSVNDRPSGGSPSDLMCRLCGEPIFSPTGDVVVEAATPVQAADDEQPTPRTRWEYHYGDLRTFRTFWAWYSVGAFVVVFVPGTLLYYLSDYIVASGYCWDESCTEGADQAILGGLAFIGLGFVVLVAAAYGFKRLTLLLLVVPLVIVAFLIPQVRI